MCEFSFCTFDKSFVKLKKIYKKFQLDKKSFSFSEEMNLTATIVDRYIVTKWAREYRSFLSFLRDHYGKEKFTLFSEKYPDILKWENDAREFEEEYKKLAFSRGETSSQLTEYILAETRKYR